MQVNVEAGVQARVWVNDWPKAIHTTAPVYQWFVPKGAAHRSGSLPVALHVTNGFFKWAEAGQTDVHWQSATWTHVHQVSRDLELRNASLGWLRQELVREPSCQLLDQLRRSLCFCRVSYHWRNAPRVHFGTTKSVWPPHQSRPHKALNQLRGTCQYECQDSSIDADAIWRVIHNLRKPAITHNRRYGQAVRGWQCSRKCKLKRNVNHSTSFFCRSLHGQLNSRDKVQRCADSLQDRSGCVSEACSDVCRGLVPPCLTFLWHR